MKNKIIILSIAIILGVIFLGQQKPQDSKEISAYIVKVVRDVNMKSPTTGWQKAVPLSTLKSGYEVKTEKGSLAMILFADQSKLILREKSIVTIKGEVKGKEILSRSVHMDRGNMVFNVKKAETEQFRFSSPISVASIRGTEGGYVTGGSEDSLTILLGLADFTNNISGRTTQVGSGQTGVADSLGNIGVGDANKNTLDDISRSRTIGGETFETSFGALTPEFSKLKSKQPGTLRVDLSSLGGKAVAVSIFYRKEGDQLFNELPLNLVGQTASGQLSGDYIRYPKLEYYLVIRLNDNTTLTIPEDGAANPAQVPVERFRRELRVPGQTGSLQKKVIILRWDE